MSLELILSEEIPILTLDEFATNRFGYVAENGFIRFIGVYNKNLLTVPNTFENLQNLELIDIGKNPNIILPKLNEKVRIIKENIENSVEIEKEEKIEKKHQTSRILWIYDSKTGYSVSKESNISLIKNKRSLPDYNKNLFSNKNNESQGTNSLFIKNECKPRVQKNLENCPSCNKQDYKATDISLELVRKSPNKLVYNIKSVSILCCNCFQTSELTDPNSTDLYKITQLIETIKKNLAIKIKKNCYCTMCNIYYKYLKVCPKHTISLHIPSLVFIRGINQQYTAEHILKEENKII